MVARSNLKLSGTRQPQFWRLLQRCCQIAGSVDIMFFFLFYLLGSPLLAWINVVSVAMYGSAYLALKKKHNRVAVILIWSEVLGHAALGTLVIGWESGFHYYLLIFIPALIASMSALRACIAVGLLWLFYVSLDVLMWTVEPVQPLSPAALAGVHLFNLSVVFAMFAYLSFFYMHMVTKAQKELGRMATTDPLTRLFNRRHMLYLIEKEIARSSRKEHSLAFLLLDIDHFKVINDVHGHEVGDKALVGVTDVLKAQLRGQDLIARWGGEEFLVVLPETGLDQAVMSAERLRQAIMNQTWTFSAITVSVTASIGVSEYREGEDLSTVIARADSALYRGKQAGRNRVEVAADEPENIQRSAATTSSN